jgi:hypothetical protein
LLQGAAFAGRNSRTDHHAMRNPAHGGASGDENRLKALRLSAHNHVQ